MSKYLIVVDVQKDFVDGTLLGSPEAKAIVPRVKEKIAEYRANGDKIIFTRDTHQDNYLETNESKHIPVVHCVEGTDGWQLYEGLSDGDSTILNKSTYGYLGWRKYIEGSKELEIEIIGLCTDICVVSNALILRATFPEAVIKVDSTACAGTTPTSHSAACLTMQMCQVEVE